MGCARGRSVARFDLIDRISFGVNWLRWPIVFLNIFGDPSDPRWGLALVSVPVAFDR
jgi:hypothetical protein